VVGQRLRELESRFRNRAQAAEVAGVSKSTFQNWVDGRSDPSFEGLFRLSKLTEVSLDWIAGTSDRRNGPVSGTESHLEADHVMEAVEFIIRAAKAFPDLTPVQIADAILERTKFEGLKAKARAEEMVEVADAAPNIFSPIPAITNRLPLRDTPMEIHRARAAWHDSQMASEHEIENVFLSQPELTNDCTLIFDVSDTDGQAVLMFRGDLVNDRMTQVAYDLANNSSRSKPEASLHGHLVVKP
jgi:transcriptional regulator with XRE-family HTH domain